jgi:hypothetical protein
VSDRYDVIRADMPPGLKRRVLHILSGHKGSDNRIARINLVKQAFNIFSNDEVTETQDRQVRDAIAELRRARHMICSDSGEGGYFIAGNYEEVLRIAAEMDSRAMDLLEKSRILKREALEYYGSQMKLI